MWTDATRIEGEADRDWDASDVAVVSCRYLAAKFADTVLDDAWTEGEVPDWDGACAVWHAARDRWLATSAGTTWGLLLQHHAERSEN
jgi:hypothetical protein